MSELVKPRISTVGWGYGSGLARVGPAEHAF